MNIYLVVFDAKATMLGEKLYPDLESYIDHNYVRDKNQEEYGDANTIALEKSEECEAMKDAIKAERNQRYDG
jgi:hypothetical protein